MQCLGSACMLSIFVYNDLYYAYKAQTASKNRLG
jgi:hypothetical protein